MEEVIVFDENVTESLNLANGTKTSWGILCNGFYTDISGEVSVINVEDISDTFIVYIPSEEITEENAEKSTSPELDLGKNTEAKEPEEPVGPVEPDEPQELEEPREPDEPNEPEELEELEEPEDSEESEEFEEFDESEESEESSISSTCNSKRRKKSFSISKKDICKKARNSGKSYIKMNGKEVESFVTEKEIGEDCLCPNKCYERVGLETIRKIFHDFWALGDYNSQNAYLFGLISLFGVKRRYTKNIKSRRNFTIVYSVKKKGENINVCKKAFLNIHGLQRNRGRVNNLANKMKSGESVPPPDQRGRHSNRPNAYSEEAIFHVKNQLEQCPKIEKKKNSSKSSKYMEYTAKRCYDLYVAVYCKEHNLLPVSLDKYRRIFGEEGYKNWQSSRRS